MATVAPAAARAPMAVQNHQRPTSGRCSSAMGRAVRPSSRSRPGLAVRAPARAGHGGWARGAGRWAPAPGLRRSGGRTALQPGHLGLDLGAVGGIGVGRQVALVEEHRSLGHVQRPVGLGDVQQVGRVGFQLVGPRYAAMAASYCPCPELPAALLVMAAGGLLGSRGARARPIRGSRRRTQGGAARAHRPRASTQAVTTSQAKAKRSETKKVSCCSLGPGCQTRLASGCPGGHGARPTRNGSPVEQPACPAGRHGPGRRRAGSAVAMPLSSEMPSASPPGLPPGRRCIADRASSKPRSSWRCPGVSAAGPLAAGPAARRASSGARQDPGVRRRSGRPPPAGPGRWPSSNSGRRPRP